MPLHLLGKKSWNVYNPENIARVRRDEAVAKDQDEQKQLEERDAAAAKRLRVLRGEDPEEDLPNASQDNLRVPNTTKRSDVARKKRKLAGEDNTDRDIRLARASATQPSVTPDDSALFGPNGHIALVSEKGSKQRTSKDIPDDQDNTGMRFKDAGGYKSDGKPWYANRTENIPSTTSVSKDVWGNEDPRRREREHLRMTASDPLLAMKRGIKQLRENDRQRKEWMEQREKDLYEVERLGREQSKKPRGRDDDQDSLEGFNLDARHEKQSHREGDRDHRRDRRHHKHKRRSRSPREEHHSHRHRHQHRSTS